MNSPFVIDEAYQKWITEVSTGFQRVRTKTAVQANEAMLRFYWELGRSISILNLVQRYGSSFVTRASEDLTKLFPDSRSFSLRNLRYMIRFYQLFSNAGPNHAPVHSEKEFGSEELASLQPKESFLPSLFNEDSAEQSIVFFVPWGHNVAIIDACKGDTTKALFFVRQTIENNWTRSELVRFLKTGL